MRCFFFVRFKILSPENRSNEIVAETENSHTFERQNARIIINLYPKIGKALFLCVCVCVCIMF